MSVWTSTKQKNSVLPLQGLESHPMIRDYIAGQLALHYKDEE